MFNGLPILTEAEEKSASRKYRNPDRSFKQHIVAHSPKSLPDALTEKEMPLINISDLLSQLRDNWEAPSTYLEKRGYLTKKRSDKKHEEQHTDHINREHDIGMKSFKDQLKRYHERKNSLLNNANEREETFRRDASAKESEKRLINQNKYFYFPHTSSKIKKESEKENQNSSTTGSPATTEIIVGTCPPKAVQPGLMARLRNSFRSLFKPSKTTSLQDDFNMYSDIMNEENADNLKMKKAKQKISNFRFDNSWLNRDSSEDFLLEKRSYDYLIPPLGEENSAEVDPSYCGGSPAPASSNSAAETVNSADLSIKFADVLKNLTQADIDYVKNFLKCYKENKEKFYVDYLHMNKTMLNVSNELGPSAQGAQSNHLLTEKNNTEAVIKCQPDSKKPKITPTTGKPLVSVKKVDNSSKEPQNTTPAAGKEDDTIKVDIDLKTNETGSEVHTSTTPITEPSTEETTEAFTQEPEETTIEHSTEEPTETTTTKKPCNKCIQKNQRPLKITHLPTPATITVGTPQPAMIGGVGNSTAELELQTNATSTEEENVGYNPFVNILKFLAHQHHPVDQVGKQPHKHLNLTRIQEMIDGARLTLATSGLGMEDESHNDTKCTPIRLNEVSLDVEWSSQDDNDSQNQPYGGCLTISTNGDKTCKENSLEPFSIEKSQTSLSDSNNAGMANSLSKYNIPRASYSNELLMYDPKKKKREIALPEDNEYEADQEEIPISQDYSELLPSLSAFGAPKKRPLLLDEYIEDYNLGLSRSAKSTGGDDSEDYDYDDNSADDNELLGRRKKKKRRKHKKYNKKSSQNLHASGSSRGNPSEFVPEDEDTSFPENYDDEKSSNDFLNFPEFSDIKFHVNNDQEEAIEKFIEGLNSPPEVFSFDVDKYLKPKSVSEPISFDGPPSKTFYEFIGAPHIENERVPFITPDSSDFQALPDAAVETLAKENHNLHPKRDILRQYIKGVSEHLAANPPFHQSSRATDEQSEQKVGIRSNPEPIDRSEALITNYANDLDVLNFERYEPPTPKEMPADDFIDKFYLLNDGSYSVYAAPKSEEKQMETAKVDPVNVGIDLDLDRKFKDLTLRPVVSKAPVEKELDLTKEPVNNLDMVYIPDNVYHKQSVPMGKISEEKSFPLHFQDNQSES